MFERRIQNQLHEWAEKNNRKPLILRGAPSREDHYC